LLLPETDRTNTPSAECLALAAGPPLADAAIWHILKAAAPAASSSSGSWPLSLLTNSSLLAILKIFLRGRTKQLRQPLKIGMGPPMDAMGNSSPFFVLAFLSRQKLAALPRCPVFPWKFFSAVEPNNAAMPATLDDHPFRGPRGG
jgi:hypothetical protein